MDASIFDDIPVIDLAPIFGPADERARLGDEVLRTCHEVGFFVVVNHGIDPSLTQSVFDHMRRLFALDDEQKKQVARARSRHFRGWDAVGSESTNNRPDIREQFDVWSDWPAHEPSVEPPYLGLLGPNQWLADDLVPGHRAVFTEWMERCGVLSQRLLGLIAVALGLEENHFDELFGPQPMALTKYIHYPPTPPSDAGVNAHHDTGFLTVLATGDTPGLQIENQEGTWIDAPVVPESFVINLGEMLQAMTGNYLVATPHRVIAATERFSAGYFHGPSLDTELAPLHLDSRFADAVRASPHHAGAGYMARVDETEAGIGDMQSNYRPTTFGEQLWNYFRRSYPREFALHHPEHVT